MLEKRYQLTVSELKKLSLRIKSTPQGEKRVRLLSVYWVGSGKSAEWVSDFLMISSRTVWRYVEAYHKQNKSDPDQRGGSEAHLNEEQSQRLTDQLNKTILKSTIEVVAYVERTFGIKYSRGGMAKWLHSHGFRYKRPHRVPRSVTVEKQEDFVKWYRQTKKSLREDEVILFMDGVHPDHQTQATHGWIRVGVTAQVPSTGKQQRVHYMGAVEIKENEVVHTVKAYDSIQSEAIIDFLGELKKRYPNKKLTIICDQGAYHTSKQTRAYWEEDPWITLIYLPPRCPNLNLIERLWKVMREHVTHNRYYAHFADFKNAVTHFFDCTLGQIKDAVSRRLRDNFQIIRPVFMTD